MDSLYHIDSYDFFLPEERIAHAPAPERDQSRLLWVDSATGGMRETRFHFLEEVLAPGDLLVVNDTRVFPARLQGHKETGGRVEFMMLDYPTVPEGDSSTVAVGLLKSSKRPRPGMRLAFDAGLSGEVEETREDGTARVRLSWRGDFDQILLRAGQVPLPPYIRRPPGEKDRDRYQTVYAQRVGAIAAPTAGLHFTHDLLERLDRKGVMRARVTLHVGYGTFSPVRVTDIRDHAIHAEYVAVPPETAEAVNAVLARGGRLWVVGTTTARALEFAATGPGRIAPRQGLCDLYIVPGYRFQVVRNLITNFHLPKSSLLFMVCALAGRDRVMAAYDHALRAGFRFYSYGDAMVLAGDQTMGLEQGGEK